MDPFLRSFHPSDLPGTYHICHTVDGAGASEPQPAHRPELGGHVYVGPYAVADPELVFVVVDGLGVAGYCVATADTSSFEDWCEREWWPVLRAQYPRTDNVARDASMLTIIYGGRRELPRSVGTYPAHLHIELSGRLQSRGFGRLLIEAVCRRLTDRGVPGVYLAVATRNVHALEFHAKLGFRPAESREASVVLVRDLAPDVTAAL